MENASKALIMAAGVLIGILILSLAIYLVASFGGTSAEIHKQNEEQQIEQFNSQFTYYVGKNDNTIYEVVTVANLATENNRYYEFPKRHQQANGRDTYISVKLNNRDISQYNGKCIENGNDIRGIDYHELISTELSKQEYDLTQYDCKVTISKTTKRVYLVEFTKK